MQLLDPQQRILFMLQYLSAASLDELAVAAVRAGRAFGRAWGDYPKLMHNAPSRQITVETINRLICGNVFHPDDELALDEVEEQLVSWFETLSGRRYLEVDGRVGVLKVIEAEESRDVLNLLEAYLAFRPLRQQVIDRMKAEQALNRLKSN